jgi:hypothetical protein
MALSELSTAQSLWNPFQLIYVVQGGVEVNQWSAFIGTMIRIGILVLLLMATLRFFSILLDELHEIPASSALIGVLIEMGLCCVILLNYTRFAEVFPNLFHRLTRAIFSEYGQLILKDASDSLSAAALEKTSENKWFSLNFSLSSIPQILSSILAGLALAMMWVVSKYQAVIYAFWYMVGPFLLPFYLFKPFRGVAVAWFRSLLGAAFMGVVGSILFILMHQSGWLMKAFASGHNSAYISALVFSLCCLFLMFSIPSLSQSIWNGISVSMSKGIYTSSAILGATVGAGIATTGAAAMGAGLSTRAAGGAVGAVNRFRNTADSGMGLGSRLYDAVSQRSAGLNPDGLMKMVHDGGGKMAVVGGSALLSQLPSAFGRGARAMGFGQSKRMTPQQRKQESGRAEDNIRDAIKERHGEDAANNLDFSKWFFSRRPGESFDGAIARHISPFENQVQRSKDASDIRAHIAKHYGHDEAAQVHVDSRRNWNLPTDQTRPDAIAQAARSAYNRNRLMADIGAVRKAAEKIVGVDRAAKIDWSQVKPFAVKKGQDQESAAENYAKTLLYKAKVFSADEVHSHDHAAIHREIERKLGPEKAASIQIPDEWRVKPKRGQTREDAIRGSTVALLQLKGLIDKSGESRVAEKHSVRTNIRNKKARAAAKKNPPTSSEG